MGIILENVNFFILLIADLLIYQHVMGKRIAKYHFLTFPLVLRLLFLVLPPVAYFATFLFLPIYSVVRNWGQLNKSMALFYGLFPVIIEDLFSRYYQFFLFPFLGIEETHFTILIFSICGRILGVLTYFALVKLLRIDFQSYHIGLNPQRVKLPLVVIDIAMIIYFVILQVFLLGDKRYPIFVTYRGYLVTLYVVSILVLLSYTNANLNDKLKMELLEQKDNQLKSLEQYSQQIEDLYQEVRSFRHNYVNVLTSLKVGIDKKDIGAIEEVYRKVLGESGRSIQDSKFDFTRLSLIKDTAIKSILSAKIIDAESKNIDISIEVTSRIDNFPIKTLDLVVILSVLLDNAIEASLFAKQPQIIIAILEENNQVLIVIENSTLDEQVSITNLYQRGFSTKGKGRGIGLDNISSILRDYPNVNLKTSSKHYRFIQELYLELEND